MLTEIKEKSTRSESTLYEEELRSEILVRFRVVMLFGAALYLLFSFLDVLAYPNLTDSFLQIRFVVSSVLLFCYGLSTFQFFRKHVLWVGDAALLIAGGGICAMIYLSDGVLSPYYQGLNLVFFAMFTMNSFRILHNLLAGGCIMALYTAAVLFSSTPYDTASITSAYFFLTSTLAFVLIMTKLYGAQHSREFRKSRLLEEGAIKLDDANQRLLATEKLKDQFFANVSHELRTPLTLILGPVRRHLATSKISRDQRADLEVIERNALLLLRHVNNLMDIAQLEADKMELRYMRIEAGAFCRFIGGHFEAIAEERQIDFSMDKTEVELEFDPIKIERVLFNLLSNAFKFTPDGGSIHLSWNVNGDEITFEVADTGPGVPQELQGIIFEPFRQGDGAITRQYSGTGLGLAIAAEFMRLHSGSISLSDNHPKGAIFSAKLPLKAPEGTPVVAFSNSIYTLFQEEANYALAEHRVVQNGDGVAPTFLSKDAPIILVAEDNPEMNNFIASILRQNYFIDQVFDGKAAIERLKNGSYDLIISDIMMPEMSGVELMSALEAADLLSRLPIIFLTAKADESLREDLLARGASDYLSKPFSASELQARVRNLVTIKKTRDLLEANLNKREGSIVQLASELADSKKAMAIAMAEVESASKAKDEFLMNLSHEIRTPLNAMLGWAQLLLHSDPPTPEIEKGLRVIERNGQLQLRLINDLLEVSRIIQGKISLEMSVCPLHTILESAVQTVRATALAKNIDILISTTPISCPVYCDAERIHQVIWNVLTNAIKFTPAEGQIEVNLRQEGLEAVLEIKDSGEGIDPAFLPFVFDRLRQADSSTTKRHGGLGLGLAIARHLVEMHGGTIGASSDGRNKGSRFFIKLPLHATASANDPVEGDHIATDPDLAGLSVLVVDDDIDTLSYIAALLKPHSIKVEAVSSAKAAIASLIDSPKNLIISDIGMPERDGIELIREIRASKNPRLAAIPALALTAFASEKMEEQAIQAGFQKYLRKPVLMNELLGALKLLTQDKSHHDVPTAYSSTP